MSKIDIPAKDLFNKLGDYNITLWVLVNNITGEYLNILNNEDKKLFEENESTHLEEINFTLKDLYNAEKIND